MLQQELWLDISITHFINFMMSIAGKFPSKLVVMQLNLYFYETIFKFFFSASFTLFKPINRIIKKTNNK